MKDNTYTELDRQNAKELAEKLQTMATKTEIFMKPHSITTAFISVGVAYMLHSVGKERAIDWLMGIAHDIEFPEDYEPENEHGQVIELKDYTVN